ncbi:hypothetical protein QUF75_13440 [Desulfococcaceae bacterium HSG7]|nr:hypothetical protein [Desulfococcaceae bacterium HSG7]
MTIEVSELHEVALSNVLLIVIFSATHKIGYHFTGAFGAGGRR